jgi:5-methylcytosine-specific restriction endonuclease McrA
MVNVGKVCFACKADKPLSDFHRNKRKKDGLEHTCKDCTNRRQRETYAKDPAAKISKTRAYHLANPEWSKQRLRASHVKHRDARADRVKKRLAEDPEFLQYRRDVIRRHESKRRALIRGAEVENISAEDYQGHLELHENRCWVCEFPFTENEAHQWDHVQPLAKGGAHTLRNLRPICAPCNTRKNARWPLTADILAEIKAASLISRLIRG